MNETTDKAGTGLRTAAAYVGFGLTLAVLVGGAVLGYSNVRRLDKNEQQVAHTHEAIAELRRLLSTLQDAETGQRGYLLAEDERYLQPYNEALSRIDNTLGRLKELTSDNPDQQARLAVLDQKITAKLDELKRTVALMRAGDRAAAIKIVRSNEGKVLMDDVRDTVAAIRQAEEDLLHQRAAESQASFRTTLLSIFIPAIIGVGLVCVVFSLNQRRLRARQRAAEVLAEQRERLRTTLASIGDAVISTDTKGRITTMNAVAESLTGWRKEEAIGQHLDAVFRIANEQTRRPVQNPATKAMKEGIIIGLANHTILIAKNGKELPIDDSAAPIRCAKNEIVGCVLVFRDVTERRRLEKENAERLIAARFLASIIESSEDAIISKSLDGIIQSWNAAAQRLFGYTAEQAVGKHISLIIRQDRAQEEDQIVSRIRAGERVDHFETVRVRSDGQGIHISLTISPIKDEAGHVVGASKIARDISDRKKAEEKIYALLAELKDADRRKDEFLATLAHELRGPLAPLCNMLEIMKGAEGKADLLQRRGTDLKSVLQTMERQLAQLVRLVDDLLDVSRITRNKLELRTQNVELASVLHQAVETCRPLAESLKHEVCMSLPAEPIYMNGDPVRLAQVFSNLLNNACKFTEPSGRIWLSAKRQGSDVLVSVKDTGVGITADMVPHIFELFTQGAGRTDFKSVPPGGSSGGLGIGLSLTRQLVEMHGGTIEASSDGPGLGSEFVVRLPISMEKSAPAKRPTLPGGFESMPPRRILVVDDNVDSTESLAMLLKLAGHETRQAYDGVTAVEMAEQFNPELVLLDIGLPKLNGFDACRRIREQPWGKNMVLVALTGWGQEEDRKKSMDAGFNHHLVKPMDYPALMKLLAELRPAAV
jgi:PAS domain S-box-containing protein